MRRAVAGAGILALATVAMVSVHRSVGVDATAQPPPASVPLIPFDSELGFFRISPDRKFGEVLGVAASSKGHIVVLNHPGRATTGPLYGNATTQLWEFDANGRFVREIGRR